jgi:hypothetical protein
LSFTGIVDTVERVVEETLAAALGNASELADVLLAESSARVRARALIAAQTGSRPPSRESAGEPHA